MSGPIKKYLKGIFFKKIIEYEVPDEVPKKWVNIPVHCKDQKITTRLWKNKSKSSACVVLIHPYHKDAKDYFLHSGHPEMYHEMGYHVVIFDFNGFGESNNIGFDFGKDIIIVSNHYKEILGSKLIIGHGISFGAAMLLKSLTFDHCIDKAIIENSLDETSNYFKKRNYGLYIFIQTLFTLIPSWRKSNHYFHVIKKVKNLKSLRLIYNEQDDLTTPSMGEKLGENCPIPYDYHLLKGKHMQAINADPIKYKDIISAYLSETLNTEVNG